MSFMWWFSPAYVLIALPLLPVGVYRSWHGTGHFDEAPPSWWEWSEGVWRGWVRSIPAVATVGFLFMAFGLAMIAAPEGSGLYVLFGLAATFLLCVSTALFTTITLWNRPKPLVPPGARGVPGVLEERRGVRPIDVRLRMRKESKGTPAWRARNSLWLVWTLGLGVLGWVSFLYIGVRGRRARWLAWAAVYLVAAVALVVITGPFAETPLAGGTGRDWGSLLWVILWPFSIGHALLARGEYLARRHGGRARSQRGSEAPA